MAVALRIGIDEDEIHARRLPGELRPIGQLGDADGAGHRPEMHDERPAGMGLADGVERAAPERRDLRLRDRLPRGGLAGCDLRRGGLRPADLRPADLRPTDLRRGAGDGGEQRPSHPRAHV